MAKGTVTNEIQYRGFNTVRMNPGDSYDCYEFFVKAGDYISHSFAIYSVSPLAGAVRARTRFIGANGLTISTSSHTVATMGGMFDEIAIEGVPVPSEARLGRLELLSPSGTYWVARPKTEDGEKATPYSQNYSGQMTYITPTGVYTGTIQANQINLTSGGDLEDSMTTINSQVFNMTSSISSLDADVTTIKAGQAEFVKFSDIDGSNSTTIIDGGIIKTGTITASSGGSYFNLASGYIKAASGEFSGKLTSEDLTLKPGGGISINLGQRVFADRTERGLLIKNASGAILGNLSASSSQYLDTLTLGGLGSSFFANRDKEYNLWQFGMTHETEHATIVAYKDEFSSRTQMRLEADNVAIAVLNDASLSIISGGKMQALGVDKTGPYRIKNDVKTYF